METSYSHRWLDRSFSRPVSHAASRRFSEIKHAAVDGANAVLLPRQAEIDRRRQPEYIKPRLQAYLDRVLLNQEPQP